MGVDIEFITSWNFKIEFVTSSTIGSPSYNGWLVANPFFKPKKKKNSTTSQLMDRS